MDINDKSDDKSDVEVALKSREENSNETGDIEVASTSKPQNDEDDSIFDDGSVYGDSTYHDSDEDDPELSATLNSLRKMYKNRHGTREPILIDNVGNKSNESSQFLTPTNLQKIRERSSFMKEKWSKRSSTSKFQSSSRSNLFSREDGSSEKKKRTAFDNDDGIGSSKKKHSSIGEFNFDSSDGESTKKTPRRAPSIDYSSAEETKTLNNFKFDSDDERSTKRDSFIKLDDEWSDDERSSNLNDDRLLTSDKPYKKYKSKVNSLNLLLGESIDEGDDDYSSEMSMNNEKVKKKEKSNKRESFDDDELVENLSGERKSKENVLENMSPRDSLPRSISIEKASDLNTEIPMEIDGTSGKLDLGYTSSLDDYVAVDKPTYSPKKKHQQRQIIIHEDSSDITELQPPFQPGSSPMKNSRRYLAINWLGGIYAVDNSTYHSITVEYNNKTLYKGYNFRDDVGYTMACLGTHGVLFAVESDTENPSVLYYKPNESWAPKSEWMTTLPLGEDIIAIALSDQAIVVATSKNFLRFFTLFGFQNYIFSFPSIVCMAAHNNLLFIAYHLSVAYKGSQNLGYVLYDMRDRGDIQKDVLPLSKESTLKWLGFSEEGLPVMFDSKGILYILHDHRIYKQARWVPVLDTANIVKVSTKSDKSSKKNSDVMEILDAEDKIEKDKEKENEEEEKENENEKEKEWIYWPVTVIESKLVCFILKYGEDVPRHPRPAYEEVDWQMPLLHLDKESGRCEERWVRESIISSFQFQEAKAKNEVNEEKMTQLKKKEKNINKIIIELIMMAVGEEKYERALELAKLLNSINFLKSALKIAEYYHVTSLAEKINHLISEKEKERERLLSRRQENLVNANRKTSYPQPLANARNSVYISTLNYNYNNSSNLDGVSQYEDTQISSLKRSVKDMNGGKKQEVDDYSPNPKKRSVNDGRIQEVGDYSPKPVKDMNGRKQELDDYSPNHKKRSVKDTNDGGEQEVDDYSPKPRKPTRSNNIVIDVEKEAIECFD